MTILSVTVQRQVLNRFGYQGEPPHASTLKDAVANSNARTSSASNISISPQAQALYEKTRAAAVTTPRAAVAPTPSEPTGNASVQAELSFDQFVERFKRLSRQYYGNEENEPISISKFSEKAQRALLDVSTRVQSKLTSSGVTLDPPIELTPDSTGSGVRVGLHPLRAKIQALLNEDASLSSEYRDAMLMHAEATQWQRVEKAHLAYYAAYDSGNVNEAHRIIQALASAPRLELIQRFSQIGIETLSRSF